MGVPQLGAHGQLGKQLILHLKSSECGHALVCQGLKWKVVLSDESRRSYASFMPSPVQKLSGFQLGICFRWL